MQMLDFSPTSPDKKDRKRKSEDDDDEAFLVADDEKEVRPLIDLLLTFDAISFMHRRIATWQ